MKVVYLTNKNVVTKIFYDVYEPKVIREKGIVAHSNGRIYGLDQVDKFAIVEDHIPVFMGEVVSESFFDFDQSDRYEENSTFDDVKEKIEEVGEDLKEEIKETFSNNEKEDDEKKGKW